MFTSDDPDLPQQVMTTVGSINVPLSLSILFGDSLCNFADGVFIGIGFSTCDTNLALTIMAMTLYHEIPQELADFFLLTRHAGFTPYKALLYNFLSGLAVVAGGLLVLVVDLSDMVVGVLLALASGIYFYIAACECIPRAMALSSSFGHILVLLGMVMVGAVPVSLTLLNHAHCDAH